MDGYGVNSQSRLVGFVYRGRPFSLLASCDLCSHARRSAGNTHKTGKVFYDSSMALDRVVSIFLGGWQQ